MHGKGFREFDVASLLDGWWGRPELELNRALMQ
jgi:hypothetical protein